MRFKQDTVSPLNMTAPCLLSNTDAAPHELHVVSERYFPVTLPLSSSPERKTIYVKRRSAHLSYRQDPKSQRTLLAQTGSFQGPGSLDLIASFTDDKKVLAFAKHLCDLTESQNNNAALGPFSVSGFCSRVLHECLVLDTQEGLPLYLAIRSAVSSVQAGISSAVPFVWDFRLIRSYYQQRRRLVPDESPRLLNSELVAYLTELVEHALDSQRTSEAPCSVFYDLPFNGSSSDMDLS